MAALRSTLRSGDATDWTGAISYTRHRNDSDSPGIADGELDGIPPSEIDSKYRELVTEFYVNTGLLDTASLLLGGGYRSSNGTNDGFLDFGVPIGVGFSRHQDTWSWFAESTLPAGPFRFDVGLRHDSPDGFDAESSTRLAADYRVGPTLRLYANYSEGYKLPSFFALSHPLIGNPDLKPERSQKRWPHSFEQLIPVYKWMTAHGLSRQDLWQRFKVNLIRGLTVKARMGPAPAVKPEVTIQPCPCR